MEPIDYITKNNYNLGLSDTTPVLASKFNQIARQFENALIDVEGDVSSLQGDMTALQALNSTTTGTTSVTDTRKVLVSLTSANLLAMNTAPVVVIAAPGEGKSIRVKSCVAICDSTATAYANGGVIYLSYNNTTPITNNVAATFLTGGDKVYGLNPLAAAGGVNMLVNTALTITNDTAPFITGTGVVRLLVEYDVVTTGL
jgi:hypothetical protein